MSTVTLIGEGGVEWGFEFPLSEVYADQVKSGKLRPADDESAAALADLLAPAQEDAIAAHNDDQQSGEKPLDKMKLAELLEHAEKIGVPEETLEPLRKNGTSKQAVIDAIAAHNDDQQ